MLSTKSSYFTLSLQGHQLQQSQYTFYESHQQEQQPAEMDDEQQQQQQFTTEEQQSLSAESQASQPQQHEVAEAEKLHEHKQQEQTSPYHRPEEQRETYQQPDEQTNRYHHPEHQTGRYQHVEEQMNRYQQSADQVNRYQHPEENMYSMARCESMTSSTSSLTSEETRSSSRSLTSPTKKMEVAHNDEDDLDSQGEQMDQQQQHEQLQHKISSDDMSSDSTQKTEHSDESEKQSVHSNESKVNIPPYPSPSKMPSPSQFKYQAGAVSSHQQHQYQLQQQQQTVSNQRPHHQQQQAGSPKKKESKQKLEKQSMYSEPKQGLVKKKKQKSKSRLVAPSSVSSKVLSQERVGKGKESGLPSPQSSPTRGPLKKQSTPVTEIETVSTSSWEPLADLPSRTKYKSIMTHPATTAHKSSLPMTSTKSSIQPPTAYSSYQQKSGLRAPSQRVNQMPSTLPSHKATSHQPDSRSSSSCSGSNERLSDPSSPISPKRSSPQHTSLRTTLSQPVPASKFRSGLPSPKRARQIPMGVTQMQSQMAAASNQNKSPKRSSPANGRRDGPVVKPMKTQEQVWEKQQVINGSNYSEQGMRGVQTSPQRQIRQPGSKIAIPIRGRGGSKLPRTSIPAPRRFDSNM